MKKERKTSARRSPAKVKRENGSRRPVARAKRSRKFLTQEQAQGDLHLNEQRLRQIIDLDPHYIFAKDAEGRYILANQAVADAYQTTVEELIGKTDADFSISPETAARFRADDLEVIHSGKPKHIPEESVHSTDGTIQTLATTKIPFTFSGTTAPAVLGVSVDVTEIKQVEKALRDSEARLLTVLEASPIPIALNSLADGVVLYSNSAHSSLLGIPLSEMIGRSTAEFYADPSDRLRLLEKLEGNDSVRDYEVRLRRVDGTMVWVSLSTERITLEGQPCLLSCLYDITERKQAEETLRQFRTLMDQSNDAIFLIDPESGRYVDCNQTALDRLGYSREELSHISIIDVAGHITSLEIWHQRVALVRDEGGLIFETVYKRKDGTTFSAEVSARVLEYGGRIVILAIVRDVTDRKQAQALQTAIYQISEAANKAISMDELFRSVHSTIGQVMPAQNFYIALYEESSDLLSFPYYVDEVEGSTSIPATKAGRGMTEYILRTGKPLLSDIANFEELARFGEVELVGPPSPIWIGAPLVVEGRTIGVIALQDYHNPDVYTERELRILEFVSGQVAKAIERTRLYEDIQRNNRILTALQKATLPLITQTELSEVLQAIAVQAAHFMETAHSYVYLVDQDERAIRMVIGTGIFAGKIGFKLLPGEGLAGRVWQTAQPLYIHDYHVWSARSKLLDNTEIHGIVGVPLMAGSRVIGVLGLAHAEAGRTFSQEDVDFLSRFAQLASIAFENARLYTLNKQELAERTMAEEALREAEAKYRTLVEQLPVVVYVNPADNISSTVYVSPQIKDFLGYTQEEWLRDPLFWQQALHPEDRARVLEAVRAIDRSGESFDGEYRMIARDGRVVWVRDQVTLLHDSEGSPLLWQGLMIDVTERKQAEDRIKLQIDRLKALRTIDMFIASGADLHLTLQTILHQAVDQLEVDAADILLLNPSMHVLEFSEGVGFRTRGIEQTTLRVGEGFAGNAVLNREMVSVENLTTHDTVSDRHSVIALEGFINYHGVPLIAKGEVEGVLEVFNRTLREVNSEWTDFLESLAGQAALAVDNASLFDSLQRSNIELGLAYETTLEGWSAALDLRDKETEGHTQRVTDLTLRLAETMGVGEKERVHIRRGALLHDIGKMGIPDRILLKPDVLTGEEWEIMRQHPVYAHNLLSEIAHLRPALEIPYCHHERWDGSGYPRGLKAEAIPLAARIFAVADVWDALCSDRPYRPAWAPDKALEYIKSLSGVHFDPKVVETFLKMGGVRWGTVADTSLDAIKYPGV